MGASGVLPKPPTCARKGYSKKVIEINLVLKNLYLMIIELQTQLAATRFALEQQGILTQEQKTLAMQRAQEIWGPRRKAIEAIGANEDFRLEDFSKFDGPIQ